MNNLNTHAACSNTSAKSRVWLVHTTSLFGNKLQCKQNIRREKNVDDTYNEFSENFVDLMKMIKIS